MPRDRCGVRQRDVAPIPQGLALETEGCRRRLLDCIKVCPRSRRAARRASRRLRAVCLDRHVDSAVRQPTDLGDDVGLAVIEHHVHRPDARRSMSMTIDAAQRKTVM